MPIPLKRRTTSRMPHRMFTAVFNWSMTSESGRFPACRESGCHIHRDPAHAVHVDLYPRVGIGGGELYIPAARGLDSAAA